MKKEEGKNVRCVCMRREKETHREVAKHEEERGGRESTVARFMTAARSRSARRKEGRRGTRPKQNTMRSIYGTAGHRGAILLGRLVAEFYLISTTLMWP